MESRLVSLAQGHKETLEAKQEMHEIRLDSLR
jgi:hypothetical protein